MKKCENKLKIRRDLPLGGKKENRFMEEIIKSDEILQKMELQKSFFEKISVKARNQLKKCTGEGRLRIVAARKNPMYYLITEKGDTNGRYLKKNELNLAKDVAQKEYLQRVANLAHENASLLGRAIDLYPQNELSQIFQDNPARRALISPLPEISTDKEFAENWQKVEYQGKPFFPESTVIYTEKGEKVRSKSEKIIADKLFSMGIPYRYEYPVWVRMSDGNRRKFHPDFTILDTTYRREILLEHFGIMDDPEYAGNAVEKMNLYAANGFYSGQNIIFTFETAEAPLDMRIFEKMILKALD